MNYQQFGQLKVEPPFWWEDVKINTFQILLYAPEIGSCDSLYVEPYIDSIELAQVKNPNYLFLNIPQRSLKAGQYSFNFFAKGILKYATIYEIKPGSEFWRGYQKIDQSDLIYLIMPDRFANGNPANDSHPKMNEKANRDIPHGRQGGDIEGVINHLDYLDELGVTTLWLTPLCEDNDEKYSYHGYAQSDVYHIDPRYGTNEEYLELSKQLHDRNMKLIKDYVVNHWGLHHWILKEIPFDEWINHPNNYRQTSHRTSAQIDLYASNYDRQQVAEGWFVRSMPDLNIKHPIVLQYLIQNAVWWISFAQLDGLRVDTYAYNDKVAISLWTKTILDVYPGFFIVGEVWKHHQAQIAYWQKDSFIAARFDYNSHLPALMDFTLHDALSVVFNEDLPTESWHSGLIKVYENLVNDIVYQDPNNLLVFMENHDTPRFNEIYDGDIRKYKMGLSLIATIRGIPQLYYGSEIGMRGVKNYGDADIRRPFPGGWPDDEQNAFAPEGRTEYQKAFYDVTKKILNWRKSSKAIKFGTFHHFVPVDNLYVYFRIDTTEVIMVVINNGTDDKKIDWETYGEFYQQSTKARDIISDAEFDIGDDAIIQAKDVFIFELH